MTALRLVGSIYLIGQHCVQQIKEQESPKHVPVRRRLQRHRLPPELEVSVCVHNNLVAAIILVVPVPAARSVVLVLLKAPLTNVVHPNDILVP